MARQRKVDIEKLHSLYIRGMSGSEIAQQFCVNKATVSKNLKKLRHALTTDYYGRVASKVHDHSIVNMNRIEKSAGILNEQISAVQEEILMTSDIAGKDMLRQTLIKLLAELRKLITTKFGIEKDIVRLIEGKEFQTSVIEKLRELGDERREKFFQWLDAETLADGFEADGGGGISAG